MGKGQTFEDLLVWQKAIELVGLVYQICREGPLSKDWGLRDQLQRASVSIPANIAEGYERESRKEYIRFLRITKGSAGETRCLAHVAAQLGYLPTNLSETIRSKVIEISRMLKGLIQSLTPL